MNSILHKVIEIVAEHFGEKIGNLTPSTRFVEDLSASLDLVEAVMACEEEFSINIPDEEAATLLTIGQLAAYIQSRLLGNDYEDHSVWPPAPRIPYK